MIFKKCSNICITVLLSSVAIKALAQSDNKITPSNSIKWDTINHYKNISRAEILSDSSIQLPRFSAVDHLTNNGRIYLRCENSGAVICAAPVKDSYSVLVFPAKDVTKFSFKVQTVNALLREGIDVESIEKLLAISRNPPGMKMLEEQDTKLEIRIQSPKYLFPATSKP